MSVWSDEEPTRTGSAGEMRTTSRDDGGRLRRPRTIRVVREDADPALDDRIDSAHRSEYGASSSAVERITGTPARSTTTGLLRTPA